MHKAQNIIYWRRDGDELLHKLEELGHCGVYHIMGTTTSVPLESYPTSRHPGETLGSRVRLLHDTTDSRPPGIVFSDSLEPRQIQWLVIGSDGSTNLHTSVATCAWVLHQTDEQTLKAGHRIEHISSLSSYRSELEGMYRSLLQVQASRVLPRQIEQWCDNKAAVDRSNRE